MEASKVFYNRVGYILTVQFGEPSEEHICEETAQDFIFLKDLAEPVIGFERLNFSIPAPEQL